MKDGISPGIKYLANYFEDQDKGERERIAKIFAPQKVKCYLPSNSVLKCLTPHCKDLEIFSWRFRESFESDYSDSVDVTPLKHRL